MNRRRGSNEQGEVIEPRKPDMVEWVFKHVCLQTKIIYGIFNYFRAQFTYSLDPGVEGSS